MQKVSCHDGEFLNIGKDDNSVGVELLDSFVVHILLFECVSFKVLCHGLRLVDKVAPFVL